LGCNAQSEQAVSQRTEALTPGPSVTLQLPPQLTSGGSGLTASTTLTLGDRVKVKQATGSAFAGIVNLGSSPTIIGQDDVTGDVWSVGSVQLGDRATVNGFLKTAGTLTPGANTTITGQLQQSQPLPAPTLPTVTVQFQNGASAVTVANDATRTLTPGDYAAVGLGARAVLALSTGDYRFDSLATQLPSTLRLTTTAGPIRIFVRNTLSWNSTITAAAGDPTKLLLGYVGSTPIAINTPFTGTLLSPNAAVTLTTASSPHSGAFFAKALSTQPDVVVTTRPFQQPCQGVVVDDGNACTTDACDPNTGAVSHLPVANGSACSDGNACTTVDSCQAGSCVGATPIVCSAQDQCHSVGVCAPATGLCSNPSKADGSSCSDGNACTQSDSCQAGACVGANPISCAAQDQCHSAGSCNAATGVCSNPAKANGSSCTDGNACTQSDTCQSGACVGTTPVLCAALDQCHAAGTCDATTGACSNPVLPDGSSCSDGNACTQTDSCQAGTCTGTGLVVCGAPDQCHVAGTCNPSTGACSNPSKADGSVCSDGSACTLADTCQSGSCVGGSPVVCAALDQCHVAGTCNSTTGACSNPTKANGATCSDGNSCTQTDACQAGACVGSNPVVCAALDQCHVAGSCNESSGICSNPAKADGSACNDANVCTSGEVCAAGLCKGSIAVATDDGNPCTADACDPAGGVSHTPVSTGTACDDDNLCNGHEVCNAIGFCSAGTAIAVEDGNPCTADSCDAQGVHHAPVATGTSCANANVCDGVETCNNAGVCAAGQPLPVDDSNPCTADSCDPQTGVQHGPVSNGVSCSDGNPCNGSEVCTQGACATGTSPVVDDANPCTIDSCDPVLGIRHLPAAAGTTCSTANGCGGAGQCDAGGQCVQPSIDDGNPCTVDACNAQTGSATHTPVVDGSVCAPVDVCHDSGVCTAGACSAGPTLNFDDGNPCTIETCDPTNGMLRRSCPPLDQTVSTVIGDAYAWLYTGSNPLQTGVAPGAIERRRASLAHGKVQTRDGTPLGNVRVAIPDHPELGSTVSQSNGEYQMVINGGGPLVVEFTAAGLLTSSRTITVPWAETVHLPTVSMVAPDSKSTAVDLQASGASFQIARGSPVLDSSGARQNTLLFPAGVNAKIIKPDGSEIAAPQLTVRATEYTVGDRGPSAMPAELPATSAYTYAIEFSADEASAQGATSVQFDRPVVDYVDNFLHFPAGTAVPLGYYDRQQHRWVPQPNGIVLTIASTTNGVAKLIIDASGTPATAAQLAVLGISDSETQTLAGLYAAGASLWRVQVNHFSTYDCNMTPYLPPDAIPPNADPPPDKPDTSDPCEKAHSSTIECQNQTLRETLPVAGTPYTLNYSSARMLGHRQSFRLPIPLSGPTVPTSLLRIDLGIDLVGRVFEKSFAPGPNLTYDFDWDGKDYLGRLVQGRQKATITTSFVYAMTYGGGKSFALPNGVKLSGDSRSEIVLSRTRVVELGALNAIGLALGGWSLDVHNTYDFGGSQIWRGDGRLRAAAGIPMGTALSLVAGTGQQNGNGDEGPATSATFLGITDIATDADGTIYVVDSHAVRRIAPDGIIHRFAGGSSDSGFSGDGGLAVNARLYRPRGVAVDRSGNVYVADSGNQRIRRIEKKTQIITTVAGSGDPFGSIPGVPGGFSGDGGPATQAKLFEPYGLAVADDGVLYVADVANNRVRRIGTDGIIVTYAGNGNSSNSGPRDGKLATTVAIWPIDLALDSAGNLFVTDNSLSQVLKIRPDSIVNTVAGCPNGACNRAPDLAGGPAMEFGIIAGSIAVDGDGSTLVGYDASDSSRVLSINRYGTLSPLAGSSFNGIAQLAKAGASATNSRFQALKGVAVIPGQDAFYLAENFRLWAARPVLPGIGVSDLLIASDDGRELFVFDRDGSQKATRRILTGALEYQFGYSPARHLTSVQDADGNVTIIERDAVDAPVAIVGPYGQRTSLQLDANGYLAAVTDPSGQTVHLGYTSDGLLTSFTDARGSSSAVTYDQTGALLTDTDAVGGRSTLSRVSLSDGWRVDLQASDVGTTSFETHRPSANLENRITLLPDGTRLSVSIASSGTVVTKTPDGSSITLTQTPDPRFGLSKPVRSQTTTMPSGLSRIETSSRTVDLANPADPFSITFITDQSTVNGVPFRTDYDGASRTSTFNSPTGRTFTTVYDARGRVLTKQTGALEKKVLSYDSRGRLASVIQGDRVQTFSFFDTNDGSNGYLQSITDALSNSTVYSRDALGRTLQQTGTDGSVVGYSWDANGNLGAVRLPAQATHTMTYTPVNLLASYVAPSVADVANPATAYAYDLGRHLKKVTRPDGVVIDYGYDDFGRLTRITTPTDIVSSSYFGSAACAGCAPGQLNQLTNSSDGISLTFSFDGQLQTGAQWSGPVVGSVGLVYNNDFRSIAETVTGVAAAPVSSVAFGYDADGLANCASPTTCQPLSGDAMTLTRDSKQGLLTATNLGTVRHTRTYNSFGELATEAATAGAVALFSATYASASAPRDALGRIRQKTEVLQGTSTITDYSYDNRGHLKTVSKDGSLMATYGYDSNGNRISVVTSGGTTTASYDAQDRLSSYGNLTFAYTANGDLATKTNGTNGDITAYRYDAFGNLKRVDLPNGDVVEYLVDAQNRRVGKRKNGVLVKQWLYRDQLHLVAELDGTGSIVSRFVYASGKSSPDFVVKAAGVYRILSDQLGSPRLLVDTSNGAVVQRIRQDEFGKVLEDTSPGFTPFGFAGGLYDPEVGLVRFGARDYDPTTGRWLAKDPIGFASGQINLYAYLNNDPVNHRDPLGLTVYACQERNQDWSHPWWPYYGFSHAYIRTDSNAFGAYPTGPVFFDPAQIVDDSTSGGECVPVPDVDEDCVDGFALLSSRNPQNNGNWGPYTPFNNCGTFVAEVLTRCRRADTPVPYDGQEGASGNPSPEPFPPGGY